MVDTLSLSLCQTMNIYHLDQLYSPSVDIIAYCGIHAKMYINIITCTLLVIRELSLNLYRIVYTFPRAFVLKTDVPVSNCRAFWVEFPWD